MREGRRLLLPLLLLVAAEPALAQISLHDLPALARARAERLRPAQEKALEPFWSDLSLDYRDNAQYLDQRIAQVATIGDSAVPILLEKLQPVAGNDKARSLAANSRRVLEKLDPASFLDALVELARSNNEVARVESIQLLGRSGSTRAVPVLMAVLDQANPGETMMILQALTRLADPTPADRIVRMLGSGDRTVRAAVLDYLVAAAPPVVLPTVLQSLPNEKERNVLPKYVQYFAAVARENEAVAVALLPFLDREKLDYRDLLTMVEHLAVIAPKDHDPTKRKLLEWIDGGETGSLALAAATTLRTLGDKSGMKRLLLTINEQLKRPQRRQDPQLLEDRANLHAANDDWKDAADDFEKVLELSQSALLQRRIRGQLIRSEAHRSRWDRMLKHLKDSGLTLPEIEVLAADDAAVREGLSRPSIRSFLQTLARDGTGR
ncbi:MAG: HEAT repeat domain-containing protein [Planctomycetota bacterium]